MISTKFLRNHRLYQLSKHQQSSIRGYDVCPSPTQYYIYCDTFTTTRTKITSNHTNKNHEIEPNFYQNKNKIQKRNLSIHASGNGWTGAMGLGSSYMISDEALSSPLISNQETSSDIQSTNDDDIRDVIFHPVENGFIQTVVEEESVDETNEGNGDDVEESVSSNQLYPIIPLNTSQTHIDSCAAGWGHSALIIQDKSTSTSSTSHLLIAGRPYDFQSLLRMNRLPKFFKRQTIGYLLANDALDASLPPSSTGEKEHSFMGRMVEKILGNDDSKDEDDGESGGKSNKYQYSVFPHFMEVKLPYNDSPILKPPLKSSSPSYSTITNHSQYYGDTQRHTTLDASVGLTAIIGSKSNTLYTMGLNNRGQCGIGDAEINHVWMPTPIALNKDMSFLQNDSTGDDDEGGDEEIPPHEYQAVSVALGLQHGIFLDHNGHVYAFGKGSRGQLGITAPSVDPFSGTSEFFPSDLDPSISPEASQQAAKQQQMQSLHAERSSSSFFSSDTTDNPSVEYSAVQVTPFCLPGSIGDPHTVLTHDIGGKVISISSGWNHSAAVTESNHAWIWGRNVQPKLSGTATDSDGEDAIVEDEQMEIMDSFVPIPIQGLPANIQIIDISCGSHHTSILMDDGSVYAVGITTDTTEPIVQEAVQIIPSGLIDGRIRQFTSHFDRTTIVVDIDPDASSDDASQQPQQQQILEVHLWSTEELRDNGVFEPAWAHEDFAQRGKVTMVHRGWFHSLVITDS